MPELLSPAGSPEAVVAAVQSGAKAVYLGYGDFNARRKAKNFTLTEFEEAVAYCHVRGVKVYLTLNTLVTDRELPAALETAKLANELGVDAVLVQDLGLAAHIRAMFPQLPLHASTQMTVHSLDGVKFCAGLGMERVVLSRELSREAISHICQSSPVEIEVFAHGALCMCYSGQCFLSAILGGRSGNRGLCAQPCRLPYSGGYPLSLKDMSLGQYLRELDDMGVACIKLEGRMKRPEYVAVVTQAYAQALQKGEDLTDRDMTDLAAAFSRDGFTQGYYLDKKGPQMFGTRRDATTPEALFAQARANYQKEAPLVGLTLRFTAQAGAPISATAWDGERAITAAGPVPETALHRELTAEEVREQLSKTGGTPFFVTQFDQIQVEPGLAVPKSALNSLRRELLTKMTALRAAPPNRVSCPAPAVERVENPTAPPAYVFTLGHINQLTPDLYSLPHSRIDLPLEEFSQAPETVQKALEAGAKLCIALPRICWDKERPPLLEQLKILKEQGIPHVLVPTWDWVPSLRELGFTLHGDFGLGVYNSATLAELSRLGFSSATASFELKAPMIRDLQKCLPTEAIVYGRLPLMMLEQPPGGGDIKPLTDRLGVTFPVRPSFGGRAELLNSQVLYLADKPEWQRLGLANLRLLFTTESPGQCVAVAQDHLAQTGGPPKNFTRGLYYRDVQ